MTGQEIIAKLNELGVSARHLAEGFSRWDSGKGRYVEDEALAASVASALGPFEQVHQKGGEGQGDEYFVVVKFTDHDVLIRLDAFYSSYDGVDWRCARMRPVSTVTRQVTFYE